MSANTHGTGTYEWADANYNVGIGCRNNCRYCYAASKAARYKKRARERWQEEVVKDPLPQIPQGAPKTIMFPSAHDITPAYLDVAVTSIDALLRAGHRLLIVSKPQLVIVDELCRSLTDCGDWREKVLFRFSIGSSNPKLMAYWEPDAPCLAERLAALELAKARHFQTSVSMEPLLGGRDDALCTVARVESLVTEKIWIGRMNKVLARVNPQTEEEREACRRVMKAQSDEEMMLLMQDLRRHPKIEWKDSIKQLLCRLPGQSVTTP